MQDGPHITSMGPFWFRPWWEGRGLRCRIGDGALSGESKPFAALSLGVGHQFISL